MLETTMFLEAFEKLCTVQHQRMKEKGFWDEEEIRTGPDGGDGLCRSFKLRPINIGEKMMLMVSELSELFEAHRKGILYEPCDKNCTILDPAAEDVCAHTCRRCNGTGWIPQFSPPDFKPDADQPVVRCSSCVSGVAKSTGVRRLTNLEEEMADMILLIADFCGWQKIDLGRAVLAKMQYNATRPHKHGKTC